MSAKQVTDKARFDSLFASLDRKSFEKAMADQSGEVKFAKNAETTVAGLHLRAWKLMGNDDADLPVDDEKKIKSMRTSFSGGLRKDVDRMLLFSTILKVGNKEMPAIKWAEDSKPEIKVSDAAEKIREEKLPLGVEIARLGIQLPLPTDIESTGQRGRQAVNPLEQMAHYLNKDKTAK